MSQHTKHRIKAIAGGILILSGLIASGCGGKKEVLSEKEMVNLITDLKLAEAYVNNNMGGQDIAQKREELEKSVMAAHHVTPEQLDSTLGWYGKNLDKYAELYEKVDKRLLEKRRKLMKVGAENTMPIKGDNLWPYAKNGMISSLGNSDGWILSIENPDIGKGEKVVWSMNLKDQTIPLNGVIGVEYEDGTAEANSTYFINRQKLELSLHSDTAKTVKRLYGSIRMKNEETNPLYVDSISILKFAYDSLEYSRYRSQKKYGYPVRITQADRRKKLIMDSLKQDSIKKVRELRRDSLLNNLKNKPVSATDNPIQTNGHKPVKPSTLPPKKPEPAAPSKINREPRPGKVKK